MINIKDFDSRLSKIDKKSCKQVDTYYIGYIVKEKNEAVNKFLLRRDKFMPEMYLKQPGLLYNVSVPFTKNKESIERFR